MAGLRLGVLGGTFDPVHVGHLILAELARTQLLLDRVLFIPAGDPWRKASREVTSGEHRLAMVRLAIADNPAFDVDEREVRRPRPSYTSETLRELRAGLASGDEIYFLLGEDALSDLPNWHDPTEILRSARLAVAPRGGAAAPPSALTEARVVRVEMPCIGISSSDLRERVRRGLGLRYLVPPAVEAYVREQGLYRTGEP